MGRLLENEALSKELLKGTTYENTQKIDKLKRLLADTDYQAIKFAEGEISTEDYEPIRLQRARWRDEINSLGG